MAVGEFHRDRARAASFGVSAAEYDRFRPGPPAALVDDLLALGPRAVLDVGCGTGKVAAALAARGKQVLGVEPDERMAALARRKGLGVEISRFEDWAHRGRQFDLVTCGDAWHWIDPRRGVPKVAQVLSPGGALACFWNSYSVDEQTAAALDAVYEKHAPGVARAWRADPAGSGAARLVAHSAKMFTQVENRSYRWARTLDGDEWVGVAGTVSDHLALGPERLARLLTALRTTITELGGRIRSQHETELLLARLD